MYEIRIHASSGQGATACGKIIAAAAFHEGKYSSSFTFDGFDTNDGTQIAYCRIDEAAIKKFHKIAKPDCIIVLDEMVLSLPSTLDGLEEPGKVIVNTPKTRFELKTGEKNIYTVDASQAARQFMQSESAGVAMAGAAAKVATMTPLESIWRAIEEVFPAGVTAGAKKAAEECYSAVK